MATKQHTADNSSLRTTNDEHNTDRAESSVSQSFTVLDELPEEQDLDDVHQRFPRDLYGQWEVLMPAFHETVIFLSVHSLGQVCAVTNHGEVGFHVTLVGYID